MEVIKSKKLRARNDVARVQQKAGKAANKQKEGKAAIDTIAQQLKEKHIGKLFIFDFDHTLLSLL